MPYINKSRRKDVGFGDAITSPGELNYLITRFITDYIGDNPDYSKFNEVMGVLECCKLELYRRMVAPYEDIKCSENGDVYR